jgi:hypothetical protein
MSLTLFGRAVAAIPVMTILCVNRFILSRKTAAFGPFWASRAIHHPAGQPKRELLVQ